MKNKYLTDVFYSKGRYSTHAYGLYESMNGERAAYVYINFYKDFGKRLMFFVVLYDKYSFSRQFEMRSYRDAKDLALMWVDA